MRYEYKVVNADWDEVHDARGGHEHIERGILNATAEEGWRLREVVSAETAFLFIFEREAG